MSALHVCLFLVPLKGFHFGSIINWLLERVSKQAFRKLEERIFLHVKLTHIREAGVSIKQITTGGTTGKNSHKNGFILAPYNIIPKARVYFSPRC